MSARSRANPWWGPRRRFDLYKGTIAGYPQDEWLSECLYFSLPLTLENFGWYLHALWGPIKFVVPKLPPDPP